MRRASCQANGLPCRFKFRLVDTQEFCLFVSGGCFPYYAATRPVAERLPGGGGKFVKLVSVHPLRLELLEVISVHGGISLDLVEN